MQALSTTGSALVAFAIAIASALVLTLRSILSFLPFLIIAVGITGAFVFIIPEQATTLAAVELGMREAAYIYQEVIEPVLVLLSQMLNQLICWYDAIVYLMNFFWQSLLYDTIRLCNGFSLVPPAIRLFEAVFGNILVTQVLNPAYVFSNPINITAIIQPTKDIGIALQNITCCACGDICFLVEFVLSPLQDDNLYCVIQAAFDLAFFIIRPMLDYAFRILFGQPITRPLFTNLAGTACRLVDCLIKVIGRLLQSLFDDIFNVTNIVFADVLCPVTWAVCVALNIIGTVIEVALNTDRVINFPTDQYIVTVVRHQLRVILNLITLPTEVVHIETFFPATYGVDIIAIPLNPPAYDYSTRLLPSQMPYGETLRTCLCKAITAFAPQVFAVFDICSIFGLLQPLVDLVFFMFDFGLNVFRFRDWAPRIDFAWVDVIFLPNGALGVFPAIVETFDADLALAFDLLIAAVGEIVRWIFEIVRLPLVGRDAFGFFLPPELFPDPLIRCSRYPALIVPEVVNSCTFYGSITSFWPALMKQFARQVCIVENRIASLFLIDSGQRFVCGVVTDGIDLVSTLLRILTNTAYSIAFQYPLTYFIGISGEQFQEEMETMGRLVAKVPGHACNVVRAIFTYFKFSAAADPCAATTAAMETIFAKSMRLIASIIRNIGATWSFNSGYFVQGGQQTVFVNRALMSRYNQLGRETGVGPRGDLEQLLDGVVALAFAPLALANLFPSFEAVISVWQRFVSGFIRAFVRASFSFVLALMQADFDFFLDFTQAIGRDTYWRFTSRHVSLWAAAADLIQSPIVWGNLRLPPEKQIIDTKTPEEYPTNLAGGVGNFVSADILTPTYANGFAFPSTDPNVVPTFSQAFGVTLIFMFGIKVGPRITCFVARFLRVFISAAILVGESIIRLMASFINYREIKAIFYDWMFGCNVSAGARAFTFTQLRANPDPGDIGNIFNTAGNCADTDGFLVAFVQLFRCPCEWLGNLNFGPLRCLCGSQSETAMISGSVGAGIFTANAELLANVAQVIIVVFRTGLGFNGAISISTDIVAPLMISFTRAMFSSTCFVTSLFGDTCSQLHWFNFVRTFVQIIFSIPFFAAGIFDRTMQNAITLARSKIKGGQPNVQAQGYNVFKFNNNDRADCNPRLNSNACVGRPPNLVRPKSAPPGEEGMFSFVSQLLFPFSQIGIDLLIFLNCCIQRSLTKLGAKGANKLVKATLGGMIEILQIIQSVFFSILNFVWQMLELLFFFLTGKVNGWDDLVRAGKMGFKMLKTGLRALAGSPMDSHAYYGAASNQGQDAIEECRDDDPTYLTFEAALPPNPTPAEYAAAIAARDAWFADCVKKVLGKSCTLKFRAGGFQIVCTQPGVPAVLNYIEPDYSQRRRSSDANVDALRREIVEEIMSTLPNQGAASRGHHNNLENKDAWIKWANVYSASRERIYSGDPMEAIAAMTSNFVQRDCRHDNIAACICPWEPEIAMGTDLCQPGRVMTEKDEQELLRRSFALSFTGDTKCDGLVRHMSQQEHWMESSYLERADLAECLNFRAISVHLSREFCARLEPGDICMWPRDLWYQPDRTASIIAAMNDHENWLNIQSSVSHNQAHGSPHHPHSPASRKQRMERLINDTRIPDDIRTAWNEEDAEEARLRKARREARRGARRRSAPSEPSGPWLVSESREERHRILAARDRTGDPEFLGTIQRNLTEGLYDRETTEWLHGKRNMPLDLEERPLGSVLMTHVVTIGSPSLLGHPEAEWDATHWRRGEFDGDEQAVERLRRGPKEDLDAYIFEHYSSRNLTGFRLVDSAHRRGMLYFIKGWEEYSGHKHRTRAPAFPRRSVEDNLFTFEERRDARLRRVATLARKTGAVGPVARDTHGIPGHVQQLHLDAMLTVDYLIYGFASGAFSDAFDVYDSATDEQRRQLEPSFMDAVGGIPGKMASDWQGINNMIANVNGHVPAALPEVVWNATVASFASAKKMYSRSTGQHSRSQEEGDEPPPDDNDDEDFEEEQVVDGEGETLTSFLAANLNPLINSTLLPPAWLEWWEGTAATEPPEDMQRQAPFDPTVNIFNFPHRRRTAPQEDPSINEHAELLAAQALHIANSTQTMMQDLDARYGPTNLTISHVPHKRVHHPQMARFFFGPSCLIVDRAISEFLRVMRYCPLRVSVPTLPPTIYRRDEAEENKLVTIYHPLPSGPSRHSRQSYHRQPRQDNPGASEDYGIYFTEVERLAKLIDYLESLIPFAGKVNLAVRLRDLISSSTGFWTNPNLDEDAGPVGARYWLQILRQCRFPESVDCARGVGLLKALQDIVPLVLIALAVIGFVPWSIGLPIAMVLFPVAGISIGIHAWRYSPRCASPDKFPPMIPMCIINEVNQVIKHFLRTCNDNWFPASWAQDGVVCPPRGVPINVLDCRALGVNSGFSIIAGAARYVSSTACSKFAGALESFVVLGPHGVAPQVVQFIRATCDNFETAGAELAVQQNVCLIWNAPLALSTMAQVVIVGLALYFVWLIGSAIVVLFVAVVPAIGRLTQFSRPEYIPGTGMASEPIQGGDEYANAEGEQ